jgi:transposase-like protein
MDHEGEYASRWATVASISAKIGCSSHTLLDWVKKAEIDSGRKSDFTLDMAASLKPRQHEVHELRQTNEILGKASAFFAQAEIIHRLDCGKHSRPSNLQHSNG